MQSFSMRDQIQQFRVIFDGQFNTSNQNLTQMIKEQPLKEYHLLTNLPIL